MEICRRSFLGSATAGAGAALVAMPALAADATFTPEAFGAKGDGITNDTAAFAAMSDAVTRNGGGTILLRDVTYLVGAQSAASKGWAFTPERILWFEDLARPLVIRGNGARLKCAPGLRYGLFDRESGKAVSHPLPYYESEELASPYVAMIMVKRSQAPVEIADLELDGNLPALRIGGAYGDTGHQIPASGVFLEDNHSTETIRNLFTHHHGQDGVVINGDDQRRSGSRFDGVICAYNGRQGISLVGGRGYDFSKCQFSHTGRSKVTSAPAAGFDIEAEGTKTIRDLSFDQCEFSNNVGCGLLAEAGDSEGARFSDCRFIGTSMWSAWANKPHLSFRRCTFVGTLVHPFASADPEAGAKFRECRFLDDPALSPTGEVYLAGRARHAIVDMALSENIVFDRCAFLLSRNGLLPWSWRATYRDCTMRQAAPDTAYPRGLYLGTTTIQGSVDLYNSKVQGSLILNGQPVAPGLRGGEPW